MRTVTVEQVRHICVAAAGRPLRDLCWRALQPAGAARFDLRDSMMAVTVEQVQYICWEAGFELAGVASAEPCPDSERCDMTYLADERAALLNDPELLRPGARSVICVGETYNRSERPSLISRTA